MSTLDNDGGEVVIGIAPSELANTLNPDYELPRDFAKLTGLLVISEQGLELEYESDIVDSEFPAEFPRPVFLGVHQPTKGIDAHAENKDVATESTRRIKRSMDLAHLIGADYFSLHLQTVDRNWADEEGRAAHADDGLEKMAELFEYRGQNGHKYKLLVENLEYPKYPASLGEIQHVNDILLAKHPRISGLVMDTGHLWHSRDLFYRAHGGCLLSAEDEVEQSFPDYFKSTLELVGHNIKAFHVTGVEGIQTHLLPDLSDRDHFGITGSDMNNFRFPEIGRILVKFTAAQPRLIAVVNEAHSQTYQAVIDNNREILRLREEL